MTLSVRRMPNPKGEVGREFHIWVDNNEKIYIGCNEQDTFELWYMSIEAFFFPQIPGLLDNCEYIKLALILVIAFLDWSALKTFVINEYKDSPGSDTNTKKPSSSELTQEKPLLNSHRILKAVALWLMILEHAAKCFGFNNVYIHTLTQYFSPSLFFFLLGTTPSSAHFSHWKIIPHYLILKVINVTSSNLSPEILIEVFFYQYLLAILSSDKTKEKKSFWAIDSWSLDVHLILALFTVLGDLFLSWQGLMFEFGARGAQFAILGYVCTSSVHHVRQSIPIWLLATACIHFLRLYVNVALAEHWTATTPGITWTLLFGAVTVVGLWYSPEYQFKTFSPNCLKPSGSLLSKAVNWVVVKPAHHSLVMYTL
eukprot:CAMPEP_0175163610 /NCGR_PEP_ID=MMETSP0087-20121206/25874_1 /TAXON_ID=136419 /ORGANISM="Unknown Unknown, Strain D1" /LENGTH=368 /DNA_ID=CAMNT_0016452391 /DNA_START=217 /DNA_END=1319 /DNA_ORIENTATION=-